MVREGNASKTQFQGRLQASCSINIKVDSIDFIYFLRAFTVVFSSSLKFKVILAVTADSQDMDVCVIPKCCRKKIKSFLLETLFLTLLLSIKNVGRPFYLVYFSLLISMGCYNFQEI